MEHLSSEQLHTLNKDALIFIVSSLQDQIALMGKQLDSANAQLADNGRRIDLLTEQIRLMNQRSFGKRSEAGLVSSDDGQLTLFDVFNEAESLLAPVLPDPEITEVTVSSYHRAKRKGKREADLDGLPARVFDHRLSDEELNEKFPEGWKELPEEIYKRLSIIPETFLVDEHHVHVYASKKNTGVIVRAPRPADLFRNSIATPPLIASMINGKYVNALPIERQSKTYRANGIDLSSNTMAGWMIKSSEMYLSLVYDRLHESIYGNRVIHADETPVKVMRIDGEKIRNGKQTYMWVYRNSPSSEHPVVLFDWQPSRRADHPREFLKAYSGTVVTDGYQVYHKLEHETAGLKIAGCWIHARRPFAEFIKSVGTKAAKGSIAQEAYDLITAMMHADNGFDDLPPSDRLKQRQTVLKKMADDYFAWVKLKYSQVTHNSAIGKALAYSINQEQYLRVFLDDPAVPMDNNLAEQAIRPFTLGRKNFVLIESSNGADASAILYSIAETAKANGLNTYKYFELLLSELSRHAGDKDRAFLEELLPWSAKVQDECHSLLKRS